MKKYLSFKINEREKNMAKRNSRLEGKLFAVYCEEAYLAGVELKEFARSNAVTIQEVLFYLNTSISGIQIKRAQQ